MSAGGDGDTIALSEWESKEMLGPDLPRPRETRFRAAADAATFVARLGGPAVAKASGVAHKSERHLVRTGLDAEGLAACFAELAEAGDGTVLVAEQVTADYELMVGGLRDPGFGPVVMVGFGGILAEVLDDVVFVLAPPEPGELRRALRRLRGHRLVLEGYRGIAAADPDDLEGIVAAVSDLLVVDEETVEVDCNPVAVADGRALVLDALVVRQGRGARGPSEPVGPTTLR